MYTAKQAYRSTYLTLRHKHFIQGFQCLDKNIYKLRRKIPHTRDKAFLDRCGQQHQYHSRVDQEYPKTQFFEKQKKLSKTQKLKNVQKYAKIRHTPFNQRSLIHCEAWFPGGPRIPKNPIFLKNGKNHQKLKNSKTSRDMPKLAIHPSTRGL